MSLPPVLQNSLSIPVIGSPLFIVSGPELVIAQCKAGIVGSFPALNARPADMLDKWIERIKNELDDHEQKTGKKAAPFAVNQIVHASNDRVMHDMGVCVKHKVPIIITSLRAPAEIVKAAHGYGGVVFHDVINIRHAKKAAEEGVDGRLDRRPVLSAEVLLAAHGETAVPAGGAERLGERCGPRRGITPEFKC